MRKAIALCLLLAACGGSRAQPPAPESGPTGRLYLAGRDPGTMTLVDVAAGRAERRRVRELGPGDPPYMVAFTGGRVVVFALGRTSTLAPDLHEPGLSLGEAWFFVPSATPGRVWLALLKRGQKRTAYLRGLREVTVNGRTTMARTPRPPRWPLAAVDGGLVMQGRTLFLWDPVSGRIVRRLPGVFPLAAHGSLLASCGRYCPGVYLADARTGERALVRPGRGWKFMETYDGAFSPDGRLLAVPAANRRLAVIDVEARTARLIPGARIASDYQLLAWASSGWLYFNAGRGRIGAWRPGAPARRLGVRVRPFVDMAAN